jgi:hypothetical protein
MLTLIILIVEYIGVDLMSNLEKSISESQCGKAIMQDLHSSGTVQKNADDEVLFKIQKLSIIPQDHIGN